MTGRWHEMLMMEGRFLVVLSHEGFVIMTMNNDGLESGCTAWFSVCTCGVGVVALIILTRKANGVGAIAARIG